MTTKSPSPSSRADLVDPGCLVSIGCFGNDATIPPIFPDRIAQAASSFETAARMPAPEDPGCLVGIGFYTSHDVVIEAAPAAVTTGRTQASDPVESRQMPEDSGCLETIGVFIPKTPAKADAGTRVLALA